MTIMIYPGKDEDTSLFCMFLRSMLINMGAKVTHSVGAAGSTATPSPKPVAREAFLRSRIAASVANKPVFIQQVKH